MTKIETPALSYAVPIALSTVGVLSGLASLIVTVSAVAIALAAIGGAFALIGIGTALFIKFYFNKKANRSSEDVEKNEIQTTTKVEHGTTLESTAAKLTTLSPKNYKANPILRHPHVTSRVVEVQQPPLHPTSHMPSVALAPKRPVDDTTIVPPKPTHRNIFAEDPSLEGEVTDQYFVKDLTGRTITLDVNRKGKCALLLTAINKRIKEDNARLKIERPTAVPRELMTPINARLIFCGRSVAFNRTIEEYRFEREGCIHLVTRNPFSTDALLLLFDLGYKKIKQNFVDVNSIVDRILRGRESSTDYITASRNKDALKESITQLREDVGDYPGEKEFQYKGKPDSFWTPKLAALKAMPPEPGNQPRRLPKDLEDLRRELRFIVTVSQSVLAILEEELAISQYLLRSYPVVYATMLRTQTTYSRSTFPDIVPELVVGYASETEFHATNIGKMKDIQARVQTEIEKDQTRTLVKR